MFSYDHIVPGLDAALEVSYSLFYGPVTIGGVTFTPTMYGVSHTPPVAAWDVAAVKAGVAAILASAKATAA